MGGLIGWPSEEELQAMDEAIAILKRECILLFERLVDLGETEREGSRCLERIE